MECEFRLLYVNRWIVGMDYATKFGKECLERGIARDSKAVDQALKSKVIQSQSIGPTKREGGVVIF